MSSISPTGEYTVIIPSPEQNLVEQFTPSPEEESAPMETPSESLFQRMSTENNWISPTSPPVFPGLSPQTYNYSQWTTQEQSQFESACSQNYNALLASESSAEKMYSTPTGQESISQALGVGDCVTNNGTATSSAIWGAYKSSSQNSYSDGCSAVAINSGMNLTMTNSLNCTFTQEISNAQNNASDVEEVNVTIEGLTVNGNMTIGGNQSTFTQTKVLDVLNSDFQSSMTNTLKSNVQNMQKSFQKLQTDSIAATPGQRSLNSMVNAAINASSNIDFKNIVSTSINNHFTYQNQNYFLKDIKVDGNLSINTSQTIVQTTIVSAIVKTTVDQIMQTSGISSFYNDQSITQEAIITSKIKGGAGICMIISICLFFCVAIPFLYPFHKEGATVTCKQIFLYSGVLPFAMFLINFSFWMVLKFLKKENSKEYLTGFILNLCTLAMLGFEFVFITPSTFPCDKDYKPMGKSSFMNIFNRLFPSKDNKEIEGGSETVPLLQGTPSAPPLRTVYRQKPSAPPQTIVQPSAPPEGYLQNQPKPSAPPLPTPNGSLIGNQTGNLKQKQKQMQRKQDQSTTPVKQQSSDYQNQKQNQKQNNGNEEKQYTTTAVKQQSSDSD